MSILSTNTRLIKVGQDYSAGSGISIDNHVISVTSVPGTTYSAGDNITIEDNVINSKDWSQDIADASANAYNEATAQIPAPFDPSYISGQIDNKLDSTAFTNWQDGQYATDLQTIEGQISNKLDASSFSDVSASFLTAINIPESATWNEVSQAYEQASGTYLTSVSIPESATWQDVSTTVQSNSAQWSDNTGDEEVNSFVYDNSATINDVNTSYQTNSGNFLTAVNIPDSANWNDTTNVVQTNSADWASHQDLSYISGVVDNKLDESAFSNVSSTFLTAHQDLSDYQTIAGMTAYQEVGDYYSASNPSGFITGVDLTPYYTTADANTLSSMLSGAIDYVSANSSGSLTGDAQGAVDTVYTISGSIISGTRSNKNFTATNVDNIKIHNTTIGNNAITNEQAGYPSRSWSIGTDYVHLGPDFKPDYWEQYQRVYLDKTGLSSMSGTSNDKKLIWRAILNTDIEGINNTITAINGSAIPVGNPEVNSFVESNSASLTEATNVVESNSAAWFDNVGDAEVNSFVYTNSATILDVNTSYQTNSGNFLTAHQDISNKLDTTAFSTVSGDFLTAHQSLDGYATEDWVTAQGYITGVDLSEYAKTSSVLDYIDSACSSKLDTTSFSNVSGDFLTTSFGISESAHWEEATNAYEQNSGTYLTSHQDLSDYQTIAGMTAYQPVGEYYSASNPSGFITGVDLTPYYTTAEANSLSSMLSGAIDYVSANAGDEFPASANEAITAYQNASGTYLTAISIPESATWNDVSTTVQTNSATWGQGGGSVTSPLGTISVDGSNIEATNSAVGTVVTPSASASLGYNVEIHTWHFGEPDVFNFTLPTSGGTLYVKRNDFWYENQTLNYSGNDLNGNIVTGTMLVSANEGTYTGDLGEIVSNLSAQCGDNSDIREINLWVYSPETSSFGVHELAWKDELPRLPDNVFTGYNTLFTGGTTYQAAIDTDVRFSAGNDKYSLTGVCSTVKELQTSLNDSRTISKSGNYYEIGNKAYKPDIIGICGATYAFALPDMFDIDFHFYYPPLTAKFDTVYLTFEATQSGTIDSEWSLYSHSGNQYTFARYLKLTERAENNYEYWFRYDYGSWGTITNVTASATVYSAYEIKELAFKDDLTGSQGGVPQSAFDELKQSYDALSSLFATYSGQWLLPNEGV